MTIDKATQQIKDGFSLMSHNTDILLDTINKVADLATVVSTDTEDIKVFKRQVLATLMRGVLMMKQYTLDNSK